jgi:hypothetical protein
MTTLNQHTLKTLQDKLTNNFYQHQTWGMPWEKGDIEVNRLRAETDEGSSDVLTVVVSAYGASSYWTMFWASSNEFEFSISDPNNQKVVDTLPAEICDLVEEETGLNLQEARS